MVRLLINVAGFYAGWVVCVLGAGRGSALAGPVAGVAVLGIHLQLSSDRAGEVRFLALVGVIGLGVDTWNALTGLVSYREMTLAVGVCPLWILSLWLIFGTTLRVSLRWLSGHPFLAAPLGAAAGPLSYWAGSRLGAVELGESLAGSLGGLALVWALALPLLVWISDALKSRGRRSS